MSKWEIRYMCGNEVAIAIVESNETPTACTIDNVVVTKDFVVRADLFISAIRCK